MNEDRQVPGASSGSSALPIVLGVLCVGLLIVCGGAGAAYFLVVRRATLARAVAEHARAEAEFRVRVAAAKSGPAREVVLRLRPGADGAVVILMEDRELGTVYDMDKVVKPLSENKRVYGEVADIVRRSVGTGKARILLGTERKSEHVAGLSSALREIGFEDVDVVP